MSDTFGESSKPATLDVVKPDASVTDFDRRVYESLAKSLWLPNDFKEYMVQYLALNQPAIPFSQVFGALQFTAEPATDVNTQETTTSTSYTNLATTGPELTGLADGKYVFLYGCSLANDSTTGSWMSLSVNGGTPEDSEACVTAGSDFPNLSRGVAKTLSAGGNNTVRLQYRVTGGTGTFQYRWLIGLRYSNA